MKGKILIVDDEEAIRNLYRRYLEELNFEVKEASDGLEAVKNCTIEYFDLVLMDIAMTNVNGIDAIKALKIIYPELEIWIISGFISDEEIEEAIKLGVKEFFLKPLHFDDLSEKLDEFFKKKNSRLQ